MWKWLILFFSYFSASYKKYGDEFRYEVAKHAVFHRASEKAKKYGVSESTVRRFVKLLKQQQADNANVDVRALPQKKMGRLKLSPQEIDEKLINMIKNVRESGAVSNYNIMIAIAKEIVKANDMILL